MKTKRILSLLLVLMLALSISLAFASCGEETPETPESPECTSHKDANFDKKCDICGKDYIAPCTDHKDENKDNKCDYCGKDTTPACTDHKDENKDKKCDACGADFIAECTEHEDADENGKCDYCDKNTSIECDHIDEDKDKKCDVCDADFIEECTEHNDTNADGKCDYCGETVEITTDGALALIKGGEAKFQFVIADGLSEDATNALSDVILTLEKYEIAVDVATDTSDTVKATEVLIGEVKTRGDAYLLDAHKYGWDGYTIQLIGTKLLILGGSDEALVDALKYFQKDILGITKKTESLTTVEITEAKNFEKIQDNYTLKEVLFAGNSIRDYVIVADELQEAEYKAANSVRENIYKKMGLWLDIVPSDSEYEKAIIFNLSTAKTCSSDKGFILKIQNGNMFIDCGFANKIEEASLGFFITSITGTKKAEVSFVENYTYEKVDYKNIYYEDFGAKGNGNVDDFFAIKEAHDYANEWGNTVNAKSTAIYYLGEGSGYETITVRTDTNWNGCKFIFDDSTIMAPPYDPKTGKATGELGDPEYYTSIFTFDSAGDYQYLSKSAGDTLPFTVLKEGMTNIGFAPGYRAMIIPSNNTVRHFIRYGGNADNGASQTELIMVEADGTIDPMTPVQWDYSAITSVTVIQLDDEPITLNGGDGDTVTHIETIFNGAPSYYTYYQRNIVINRANLTVKNIKHTIIGEDESPTGAPYTGFFTISRSENVSIENCEFQCPKGYRTMGSGGVEVGMGTYEINASYSNNILWKDCKQSNFFQPDGSIKFDGMMGTNYCKNLNFDNVFMCSFDAHKGTYNATLKNSTCEHINFIGEGTITLENVTIHANASKAGIILRSDYGSTWQGDLIIDGLDLKYYSTADSFYLELARAEWNNHFFGYTTYLPETIVMRNVTTTRISYTMVGDTREEKVLEQNVMPLHLYRALEGYSLDISNPDEDMRTQPTTDTLPKCNCKSFNDNDGDGICNNENCGLPEVPNIGINRNPYMPTKEIYIYDCPGLYFILPRTPQFKDMKIYVEDELVDWYTHGFVKVPEN